MREDRGGIPQSEKPVSLTSVDQPQMLPSNVSCD
jgi:hypothetical protein